MRYLVRCYIRYICWLTVGRHAIVIGVVSLVFAGLSAWYYRHLVEWTSVDRSVALAWSICGIAVFWLMCVGIVGFGMRFLDFVKTEEWFVKAVQYFLTITTIGLM